MLQYGQDGLITQEMLQSDCAGAREPLLDLLGYYFIIEEYHLNILKYIQITGNSLIYLFNTYPGYYSGRFECFS